METRRRSAWKDEVVTPEGQGENGRDEERALEIAERVLARQRRRSQLLSDGEAVGGAERPDDGSDHGSDDGSLERFARQATRRVESGSTELEDVSEVEYRKVRLERVVLVGIYERNEALAKADLAELAALADTAGSTVLASLLQRRALPDAATYLGRGKASELADLVKEVRADTVIVDADLAPSQRRSLEDIVKVKVVDRTALILDIFAQHAKSREGKAQVELAQLEYLLPRLRGWGESMSRQAGGRVAGGEGIGSRGPGETQIELDRRRIRRRMAKLRRQIAQMAPARAAQRASRRANRIPSVVIVGYTNAGKSTLLNRLTGAGVMVEDALFATLDPTVRQCETSDGRRYTLTDTVGFIRRLPTQLVEAFHSTLEEVGEADLILHLVDASHPQPLEQIRAVHAVLDTIEGARDIRELVVLNKVDQARPEDLAIIRSQLSECVSISARTGQGIGELTERIEALLPSPPVLVDAVIPYQHGDLVSAAHQDGEIVSEEYLAEGTHLVARVAPGLAARIEKVSGRADTSDDG